LAGTTTARPENPNRMIVLAGLAGATTVIVIIGFTIALFFNPLWIAFEQERSGVPSITGYTPDQVHAVTGSILADLVFGPPAFGVAVNGQPVLDAAERSHMVDVRSVLMLVTILFGIATVVLVALVAANRRSAWVWRAIARASGALAAVGVAVGVAVLFFFDAAFQLFHLVFFPQGNFSFDPRTERLTQLFPDQFWTETSIGVAALGLVIAVAVTLVAWRRAAALAD
jgi:integral membrane protein (TIGR01906 family)